MPNCYDCGKPLTYEDLLDTNPDYPFCADCQFKQEQEAIDREQHANE